MPRIVVLYPLPVDAPAFESAYLQEHVPLVRAQMPTVQRLVASPVAQGRAGAPYYWMGELHFESIESLKAAAASAGGQRAMGHAQQISTGGPPVVLVVNDPL